MIFLVVLVAAIVLFKNPQGLLHYGEVIYAVIIGFIALCLVIMEPDRLMGGDRGRRGPAALDAATMIAMRHPRQSQAGMVGDVGHRLVFIAGITSICGFIGASSTALFEGVPRTGTGFHPRHRRRRSDAGFAAVLAAVSSGVMQPGSVYEVSEYRMLVLKRTAWKTLNRARFIEVLSPAPQHGGGRSGHYLDAADVPLFAAWSK